MVSCNSQSFSAHVSQAKSDDWPICPACLLSSPYDAEVSEEKIKENVIKCIPRRDYADTMRILDDASPQVKTAGFDGDLDDH
jgi:hypothetical protein